MKRVQGKRSATLDIARGLTVMLMILVNHPGSWDVVYAPLLHAKWNGATLTDFVFPNFLFLVGVSIAISLRSKRRRGMRDSEVLLQAAIRSAKLFGLGVFLWLFPDFDWGQIRWPGVLQRIAVCSFLAVCIALWMTPRAQWALIGTILILYAGALIYVPIPHMGDLAHTVGAPDLSVPGMNVANYLDSRFLPGVLWEGTWDPEGLLSTLPALVTTLLGMMLAPRFFNSMSGGREWVRFVLWGIGFIAAGLLASQWLPLNKHIWTSSYVLYMAGYSILSLAVLVVFVEWLEWRRIFASASIFGSNAIFAYVLAGILTVFFYSDRVFPYNLSHQWMTWASGLGLPPATASALFAVLYVGVILALTSLLHRRGVFLKI